MIRVGEQSRVYTKNNYGHQIMWAILSKHNSLPLLFSVLISILLVSASGYTRTWYVKSDQTGDAPTIEAAIDSASTGDTVLVASGTYVNPWIECYDKDNLAIISEEGPEETILQLEGPPLHLFMLFCDMVVLKGFTFENNLPGGVHVYQCSNVLIEDNIFCCSSQADAVMSEMSANITINNNLIHSNYRGIICADLNNNVTISNNTIAYNADAGLLLDISNIYNIFNNLITNNAYGVVSIATNIILSCNNVFNNVTNYDLAFSPDPTGTNGNISLDPQFCGVDPSASGNFYLQSDSPCAPGNQPDGYICGVIGKYDVGCGSISTEETSWGKIKDMYR